MGFERFSEVGVPRHVLPELIFLKPFQKNQLWEAVGRDTDLRKSLKSHAPLVSRFGGWSFPSPFAASFGVGSPNLSEKKNPKSSQPCYLEFFDYILSIFASESRESVGKWMELGPRADFSMLLLVPDAKINEYGRKESRS